MSAPGNLTIVLGVGVAFAACSTSSKTPSSPTGQASQTVGPSGGTVTAADGTQVVIPPGALANDVTITIAVNESAPPLTQAESLATAHVLGPEGQQFLKPVQVTLGFENLPSGVPESAIVVYTAPQGSSDYVPLPTAVADSSHVTAQTTHFSNLCPAAPLGDGGASEGGPAPEGGAPQDATPDSTADGGEASVLDATSILEGGSDSTTGSDGSATDSSSPDASTDSSNDGDGGAADAPGGGDAAFPCVQPPNPAPAIQGVEECGPPPTPAGGTILDGTYYLTSGVQYSGDAGCSQSPGQSQGTIVVSGGTMSMVIVNSPQPVAWAIVANPSSGTSLAGSCICGIFSSCADGGGSPAGYTATSTSLAVFPQPNAVLTFTKQ